MAEFWHKARDDSIWKSALAFASNVFEIWLEQAAEPPTFVPIHSADVWQTVVSLALVHQQPRRLMIVPSTERTALALSFSPIPISVDSGYCNICFEAEMKVVLSFLLTAGIADLGLIFAVIFDLFDTKDNLFDTYFSLLLKAQFPGFGQASEFWRNVNKKFLLSLSDGQLVTGTALLIVAIYQIPMSNGHISVYHFSLVTDLAWFSAGVHQNTCYLLRGHLLKSPVLRIWRTIWILVMGSLLLFALVVSSHKDWYVRFSCPVECLKQDLDGNIVGSQRTWLIAEVILVVYGYTNALMPLSVSTRRISNAFVRMVDYLYGNLEPSPENIWAFWLRPLHLALYKLVFWTVELVDSNLGNIVYEVVWFTLGIQNVFADRELGALLMLSTGANEDGWGFGQVVPLLLLALPVFSAMEIFFGTFRDLCANYSYIELRNDRKFKDEEWSFSGDENTDVSSLDKVAPIAIESQDHGQIIVFGAGIETECQLALANKITVLNRYRSLVTSDLTATIEALNQEDVISQRNAGAGT